MSKFETLCNEYRENKRLIEDLQAMNDGLKTEILQIMDGRDVLAEGATKCTNKLVSSARFDTKGFSKDHPDLYATYTHTSTYNRFTVI